MPDATPEPLSRCGACGATDDHPKHMVLVGFNNTNTGGQMFHEHDDNRDGVIEYHFDCPTPWHGLANGEHHAKLAALCGSGIKGDALRARILEGTV